jgi:rhodanese-related sulfurtransferase
MARTYPRIHGLELKKILESVCIIDCRSEAEYAGGYIRGAKNISTFKGIKRMLSDDPPSNKNHFVLYCEYSERRAPRM